MHALPPTDPDAVLSLELEPPLLEVESCLNLLSDALLRRDTVAVEQHAAALHQALAKAVDRFSQAARHGSVPPQLRHRLAASPLSARPWPAPPPRWTARLMC